MAIAEEIQDILRVAKKKGLSKREVQDVLGLSPSASMHKSSAKNVLPLVLLLVAIVWGGIFGFKGPKRIQKDINESFSKSVSCLIDQSEASLEFVRPLSNCTAMCAGMKEVPRLESITREDFISKYAYSGRPLVVTGVTKNWTALNVFSFKYFKKLYNSFEDAFDVQDSNCQFFGYKTNFQGLEQVFGMSKQRAALKGKPWYIGWSNCHTKAMKELRKHYQTPNFLPTDSETSQQDWMFMGGTGPGAPIHIDTVDRPSWQAQISGKKSWQLLPPAECESVCHPVNITMNKGDLVILDTNQWFHSTYIHAGDMSITIGAEFD